MVSITYGHGFLDDCNNMWSSTGGTADAGSSTVMTVDAERTEADGYWLGYYIKYTSGSNSGQYRLIHSYVVGIIGHEAFSYSVVAGDTYVLSSWKQNASGMNLTQIYLYCENDNEFKIKGVCDSSANEYTYIEKSVNSLWTSYYTKYYVRWRTIASANALGIVVQLVFSEGDPQNIVGSPSTPSFSTSWKVTSGTVTPGKFITAVRVYADDYPIDCPNGEYYVLVDFILLCRGAFTLPNVAYGLDVYLPPRDAIIGIPSRVTDVIQALGSESATVTVSCDLNRGNWKRYDNSTPPVCMDYRDAEVFYDIAHNSYQEAFQWLDTGSEQFKVRLENSPRIRRESDGKRTRRTLDLMFREYARNTLTGSPPTVESYRERFGLNLV